MTLGQRVAVMRDGHIQQVDTPQALYRDPANLFVASFIGSPAMNLVEAAVTADAVEFADYRIPIPPEHRPSTSGKVVLGIRPESFEDAAFADPSLPQIQVEVAVLEELGADSHVIWPVAASPVTVEDARQTEEQLLLAGEGTVFTARVDPSSAARAGRPLRLALDPAGFHYFDRATGERVRRAAAMAGALTG